MGDGVFVYLRCFAVLIVLVLGNWFVGCDPCRGRFLGVCYPEVIASLKPPANGCDPCWGLEIVSRDDGFGILC